MIVTAESMANTSASTASSLGAPIDISSAPDLSKKVANVSACYLCRSGVTENFKTATLILDACESSSLRC
jgi:hypothetical protein